MVFEGGELVDFSRMAQERPTIDLAKQALPSSPEEKKALRRQIVTEVMSHPEMGRWLAEFCAALVDSAQVMYLDIGFVDGKTSSVMVYIKTAESLVYETVPFLGDEEIPDLPYLDLSFRLRNKPLEKPICYLVSVVSESIARLYGQPSGQSHVQSVRVQYEYDKHKKLYGCVMRVII